MNKEFMMTHEFFISYELINKSTLKNPLEILLQNNA